VRVLGLVPARGGSRRLPGKNLAQVGGRTLVRRALETALAAGCFETVALSSEDHEILAEAGGLPGVVSIRRPPELATDTSPTHDAVVHALGSVEAEGAGPFDAVAVVQCTAPLTAAEDLAGAVALAERTGAGSVVSVSRVEGAAHPLRFKRLEGYRLLPFLADDEMAPSHELPELYARNGAVYVSRRETIEAGRLDSDDMRAYVMPPERSLDVDGPLDLEFARFLVERGGG
jgi:CMP-N,N'-diacetyllegionaminic acid synthase